MELTRRPMFGPACMLVYVPLFVATNALTKALSNGLPLAEIAFFRYAVAVPVIGMVLLTARTGGVRVSRAGLHLVRGALAAGGSFSGYAAMASLPLGDATALFYLAPCWL